MDEKKKKRILIFSLAYHPFVGGAEIAIKEITDRIPDVQFDVITLRLDSVNPAFEQMGNVFVYRVGFAKRAPSMTDLVSFPWYLMKVFYPLLACVKACALHREKKYDAVWAMMAYAGFAAVLFRWKYSEVPYILTLQEGDSIKYITKRWRMFFVRSLLNRVFRTPSLVQTISSYLGEFAKSMGYKGQIEIIPNGVDIKKFISAHIRSDIKKSDSVVKIITTSRLVYKNAVDDIIRALALLPKECVLEIVGSGQDEKTLRYIARNLDLEDRVIFAGEVKHEQIPTYLHKADIFVRPSRSEGMGNSFIEAMAAGLPVIATPVGCITDFLKDDETGLFCEVNNPESVAAQVKRLMEDKALREKISANARAMVEEKYDWNIIAKQMKEKVFEQVLKS